MSNKRLSLALGAYLTVAPIAHAVETSSIRPLNYAATASSELQDGSRKYEAKSLRTLDIRKSWCEGKKDDGVGEWIEARLAEPLSTTEVTAIIVKVLPGIVASDRLFQANNRPAIVRVVVYGDDVSAEHVWRLLDQPSVQGVRVDIQGQDHGRVRGVKIRIEDVYKGSKYRDTCITELQVFGEQPTRGVREKEPKTDFERAVLRYQREEGATELEVASVNEQLIKAKSGDYAAINSLQRLSVGYYAKTAEGSQYLSEIYVELLVAWPERFLFLLSRQEGKVQEEISARLKAPVTDRYSDGEILTALKTAHSAGVAYQFVDQLISFYKAGRK